MSGRKRMLCAEDSLSIALLVLAVSAAHTCDAFSSYCNTNRTVFVTGNSSEPCTVIRNDTRCSSLQSALELVAIEDQQEQSCTIVEIAPGEHTMTRAVAIANNVFIRGSNASTRVVFDLGLPAADFSSVDPIPVLTAHHSRLFGIEGVVFDGSSGFIQIHNVTEILLADCTFRYFIQGAVNVYNFNQLTVVGCIFEHNGPASFIKFKDYKGHTGGLSVSLFRYPPLHQPEHRVSILDSIFLNNSALPTEAAQRSPSQLFNQFIFTGRGGALGFFFGNDIGQMNAEVTNCSFENNVALTFGGAAYVVFAASSNHTVVIQNCVFRRNRSGFGAGALFAGFFDTGTSSIYSTVSILDTQFIENSAQQGGSSVVSSPGYQGHLAHNHVGFENCTFIGNSAEEFSAAITFNTLEPIHQLRHANPTSVTDCKFINNSSPVSATIGIVFVPISFYGHNVFDGNQGGAIQVSGSNVNLYGRLDFLNHRTRGSPDGALSVTSFGQLVVHKGTSINFINNTGEIGAAVSIEAQIVPSVLSKLLFNPLCFLQYEHPTLAPDEWDDVEITFVGNIASESSVAVIHLLDLCSWINTSVPFFNKSKVLQWDFVTIKDNENHFYEHTSKTHDTSIHSDAVAIYIDHQTPVDVYPGAAVSLNVRVVDELNSSLGATIRLENSNSSRLLTFQPAAIMHDRENEPLHTSLLISDEVVFNQSYLAIATAFLAEAQVQDTVKVTIRPCPPGYALGAETISSTPQYLCQCNSMNNSAILDCEEERILLVNNWWATKDTSLSDSLFVHPCPAGYCQCQLTNKTNCVYSFKNDKPDKQCACGRKGILCGECSNSSYGVSALLNHCVTCHNAFAILIPVLIIANVGICILMLRFCLKLRYPTWIFPCVFYIQVLPYITEHFGEAFGLFRPYLYFISSALSFYFPYDFCLYSNMSALVSYSLKFIPVVFMTTTTLIYLSITWNCYKKHCNKDWHMQWLILLLIYPHTLHSAIAILNCPSIPSHHIYSGRWFTAGHVTCFTGGHAALGVFAVVIIVLCVLVIPISFVLSIYENEDVRWLERLSRPASYNFKDKFKWWYSIELGRRFLLVLMTLPFPQNNYPALFTQCVLMVVFLYIQPYSSTIANVLEGLFSILTTFMLLETFVVFQNQFPLVIRGINSACSDDVSIATVNTWIWTVAYYTPLVVTLCLIVLSMVQLIRKRTVKEKRWFPNRHIPRQTVFLHRDPNKTLFIDVFKSHSSKLSIQNIQLEPESHIQQSDESNSPV